MAFSQVCVTVAAPTMAELRRRRDQVSGADLVELRLDAVDAPDVAGALQGRRGPVLVTCRPTWEGGAFDGSEEARLAWVCGGRPRRGALASPPGDRSVDTRASPTKDPHRG